MKTEKEVRDIIDIGFMWSKPDTPDEYCVHYATDEYRLTSNELALVDTRLPLVAEYILQWNADRNMTGPHGSWARGSLAMWNGQTQEVRGTKGETLVMLEATVLTRSPPNGNNVLLYGEFVEADYVVISEEKTHHFIGFAKFTGTKSMLVDPKWLDDKYPGWDVRMAAMEALAASGAETAKYVLNNEPAPLAAVTMNEVGFG